MLHTIDPASSPRAYPAHPLIGASIAVFRRFSGGLVPDYDAVLLARRTRPPFAGAFSLPGGLVEIGEHLEAAALRELGEEVSVEARIVAFNRHVESIEEDSDHRIRFHFVIASFVGEWLSGEGVIGPEASEILWARPDALPIEMCTPMVGPVVASAYPLFLQNRRC